MVPPKLRIVYYEKNGTALSYFYLEKSEALRAIAILKMLPNLQDWIPVSFVASKVKSSVLSAQSTILKLSGALYVDIINNGKLEKIAKRPVLLVKKEKHNTRNNMSRYKYLRAVTCLKRHS